MEIHLHPTTKIVELNGVPARIWEGHTNSGIPIHAYITRLAVQKDLDATLFEAELQQCEEPSIPIAAIPLRLIL